MNITGTWTGEYAFDDNLKISAVVGRTVTFTMTLKQGWFGFVSGTVQDDARNGFPEAGTIKGRLKGDTFGFHKVMPVLHLIHENNRMTLEQWADRHKVVMDANRAHPSILHRGKISADGKSMEGKWRINEAVIDVPGSYEKLQMPVLSGAWKMTRKD